jgi:hypothetical protein
MAISRLFAEERKTLFPTKLLQQEKIFLSDSLSMPEFAQGWSIE